MLARALIVTLLLGTSASAKYLEIEPFQPASPTTPIKVPPPLGIVQSVDFEKGTFTAEMTIQKAVPPRPVAVISRKAIQTYPAQSYTGSLSSKKVRSTFQIKNLKVYDAAGFELKPSEIKPRLKPGITIAVSHNAKQTSLDWSKVLKLGSLIVVDPSKKAARRIRPVRPPVGAPVIDAPAIEIAPRINRRIRRR